MYLIIDGTNMAHRARHAYQLSTKAGKDTSVTYGVMRMLMALIKKHKPTSVIFCWDGGTPGFRKRLVPSYKATRSKKKADDPDWSTFTSQLEELEEALPLAGILSVRRRGIEADDLIAQAAKLSQVENMIVSTDEDMLQCVSEMTSMLRPKHKGSDTIYTIENFEELVGVPIFQYVAYKVLQGDNSDNIRGVRGIGPKTAARHLTGIGKLAPSVQDRLNVFIEDGEYNLAYTVMDLTDDRAGARYVLLNTEWQPYSKKLYQWCINNGFTSLVEAGSIGSVFGKLKKPEFGTVLPIPRIWDYKREPDVNPMYDGQEIEI